MMGQGVTVQGWKVRICLTTEPPKTWGFFAPRAASGRARLRASRARGTARAHLVVAHEHRDDAMRAPVAPRAHPAPKRAPSPITPHPTLSTQKESRLFHRPPADSLLTHIPPTSIHRSAV